MTERPILFSAPMVRALLDGRKTQTRRVFKAVVDIPEALSWREETSVVAPNGNRLSFPEAGWWTANVPDRHGDSNHCYTGRAKCPYGKPGDRLWVRETWAAHMGWDGIKPSELAHDSDSSFWWAADRKGREGSAGIPDARRGKWRPSIFMPRWASRITLEISEVRVERLQEISEQDAIAEGVTARDVYAWTLASAAKTETMPLCWIETPEQSSDEEYCRPCAEGKLVEILATRADGKDCFVDGGWGGHEADGPRFCETCGVTLEVSYTDYAVEEELNHFKTYGAGPVGAYELNRLASSVSGEAQEREFSKIGYRWLWESINGPGSWDANPWVWAITFKVVTNA